MNINYSVLLAGLLAAVRSVFVHYGDSHALWVDPVARTCDGTLYSIDKDRLTEGGCIGALTFYAESSSWLMKHEPSTRFSIIGLVFEKMTLELSASPDKKFSIEYHEAPTPSHVWNFIVGDQTVDGPIKALNLDQGECAFVSQEDHTTFQLVRISDSATDDEKYQMIDSTPTKIPGGSSITYARLFARFFQRIDHSTGHKDRRLFIVENGAFVVCGAGAGDTCTRKRGMKLQPAI